MHIICFYIVFFLHCNFIENFLNVSVRKINRNIENRFDFSQKSQHNHGGAIFFNFSSFKNDLNLTKLQLCEINV